MFLDVRAGRPITVTRVTDSRVHRTTFGIATATDRWVAAPAPDGTKVAIIRSPDPANVTPGDLQVVTPGGTRKTLAHQVPWGGGLWPAWTPDGTAIIVGETRYDAATGAKTHATSLPDATGYLTWSPDGSHLAYAVTASNEIAISRADGTGRRLVSLEGLTGCDEAGCPESVQAVSPDGRYVALGQHRSDPSHQESTVLVYDTRDRREIALPGVVTDNNGEDTQVYFRDDGGLLIRAKKDYLLVDPAGATSVPLHLPAGVTGRLTGYTG
jgi:Tol biopolymer transport system component